MRSESRGARRGFTLAELLVTLGIIAFLVAISVPTLGPMMRSTSADRTASIIRGGLMAARGAAVARREAGICWIVSGSVWESGELSPVSPHSYTLDLTGGDAIIIDNKDSRFTADSAWTSYTKNDAYPPGTEDDNYVYADGQWGGATGTATWTFDIPSEQGLEGQSGQLTVEGWWPVASDPAGDTQWTVSHAPTEETGQTSTTKTISQLSGDDWKTIGTFPFRVGGEGYTITLSNATGQYGKFINADAVKISGTIASEGREPHTEFRALDVKWPDNKWQATADAPYHVVVANKQPSGDQWRTLIAEVAKNDKEVLTAKEAWEYLDGGAADLHSGSYYLIQLGDPLNPGDRRQSIGFGAPQGLDWTDLPQRAAVSVRDATDKTRTVWPIIFSSTGRAALSSPSGYVTIMIYDPEKPNNQEYWRFIRVYANTGRTREIELSASEVDR